MLHSFMWGFHIPKNNYVIQQFVILMKMFHVVLQICVLLYCNSSCSSNWWSFTWCTDGFAGAGWWSRSDTAYTSTFKLLWHKNFAYDINKYSEITEVQFYVLVELNWQLIQTTQYCIRNKVHDMTACKTIYEY